MKWLRERIATERDAMCKAVGAFASEPTEDRLHDVRTRGRRLRSLLEDVRDADDRRALRRDARRAAELTDAARDAAVIIALLNASADPSESAPAAELLAGLERRRVSATESALEGLGRLRFSKRRRR